MAFYEWSDRLSVKVPSIDRQHKTLIGYINKLAEALEQGNTQSMLGTLVGNLSTYTQAHFAYEELLFDRYEYPQSDAHKRHHVKLIERVQEYSRKFEAGGREFGPELLGFLKEWLNHHILQDDMAYSGHMTEQGAQ
jgi:hemerythrin-like metal-binding protein